MRTSKWQIVICFSERTDLPEKSYVGSYEEILSLVRDFKRIIASKFAAKGFSYDEDGSGIIHPASSEYDGYHTTPLEINSKKEESDVKRA